MKELIKNIIILVLGLGILLGILEVIGIITELAVKYPIIIIISFIINAKIILKNI